MTNENELEVICRTCLNETTSFKCIYKVGMLCGEITTLSAMLNDIASIEFNEAEDLPRFICNKCVRQLIKCYLYRQSVIKANETLREQQNSMKNEEGVLNTLYYYEQAPQCDDEPMEHVPEVDAGEIEVDQVAEEDEELHEILEEEEEDEDGSSNNQSLQLHSNSIKIELNSNETSHYEYAILEHDQMMIERNEEVIDESSSFKGENERSMVNDDGARGLKSQNNVRMRRKKLSIPGPPFRCEICGKNLSNHSSYRYHMQLHSDATPFLCSHCGEKFKTRNAYDGHMTTHNAKNPNVCNLCGKKYRQASSLRMHILTHTGEKPYLCGICGKGLTQKSGFKKHMLVHTGEKPFSCDICGKEFRYSSNLITHKRCHSGEKPYDCQQCDKKFASGEQLRRHVLIHTGERPYSCDTCHKAFNRRSTLMVHKQVHKEKTVAVNIKEEKQ